ncbi:hypothetical protein EXIGLDRAFT_845372 [Exidia glandulosa HHB12029]|uniref:EF-hand domain-containing protein n=1 Tax=Exidia glandulosa HHB12029 TaxID=1314781 RepID=A0A165BH39_EXIGL|nr:hypothetical protein EXIGLDRAFT_845372 [Exidia glandulosa HHB12029]
MTREDIAKKVEGALDTINKLFTASTLESVQGAAGTMTAMASTASDPWRPRLDEVMEELVGLLGDVSKFFPAIHGVLGAFKAVVHLVVVGLKNERQMDVIKMTVLHLVTAILEIAKDKDLKKDDIGPLKQAFTDVAFKIAESAAVCRAFKSTCRIFRFLGAEYWASKLQAQIDALNTARVEFHNAVQRSIHQIVTHMAHEFRDALELLQRDFKRNLKDAVQIPLPADGDQFADLFAVWKRDRTAGDSKWNFSGPEEFRATVKEEAQRLERDSEARIKQFVEESRRSIEDLIDRLGDKVDQAADRVVEVVRGEAFKLVNDPDVRDVWREMHWPVSVQASQFVVAVKDHFSLPRQERANADPATFEGGEIWATQYISISRTRPLIEAIDQDNSGWISVREINAFTAKRNYFATSEGSQSGWHLSRLFAFWAAGFPSACWAYARRISAIRARMVSIAPNVLPVNRPAVEVYLGFPALRLVDCLSHGTLRTADPALEALALPHFGDHILREEIRLLNELERLEWNVEDSFTISRITADGGPIERFILPLLFLILKRHLAIIQYGCNSPIHGWELWESIDTIYTLLQEFGRRYDDLASSFRNQGREPKTEFNLICNGMFSFWMSSDRTEFGATDFDASFNDEDRDLAADPAFARSWLRYPDAKLEDTDGPRHGSWLCNACGGHIKGSRIWCLQCRQKDGDTIDLCGDKAACAMAFGRSQDVVHLPEHDLLKIYRLLQMRDRGRILAMAKLRLDSSSRLFELSVLPSEKLDSAADPGLLLTLPYSTGSSGQLCIKCGDSITSPPCWLCIECDDTALLCDTCDELQPLFIQEIDKVRMMRLDCPFDPEEPISLAIDDDPNGMQANFYSYQRPPTHRWWHVLVRLSVRGPVPNDTLAAKLAIAEAELASKQAELERTREELEGSQNELALAEAKLAASEARVNELELEATQHRKL